MSLVEFTYWCCRLCAGGGGLLFLYAGCFLYPDEQERLQNVLEDWWIKGDEASKATPAFLSRVIQTSAASVSRLFDRAFGPEHFSARFAVVSCDLSIFWFILAYAVLMTLLRAGGGLLAGMHSIGELVVLWTLVILDCLPLILRSARRGRVPWFWYVVAALTVLGTLTVPTALLADGDLGGNYWLVTGALAVAIALGVPSDMVSLFITRKILRLVQRSRSTVKTLVLMILDLVAATCLVGTPVLVAGYCLSADPHEGQALAGTSAAPTVQALAGTSAAFTVIGNVTNVIPSCCYITIGALLVVHRLIWPVALRPLYALISVEVFARRKSLVVVGAGLVALACPPISGWLRGFASRLPELLG